MNISGNTLFSSSQFPLSFMVRELEGELLKRHLIHFQQAHKRSHLLPLVGMDGLPTVPWAAV